MNKISRNEAVSHGRPGVKGFYYQLPEVNEGTTVAYAEFTGEHGERTVGERARIYYILEGKAKFVVNGNEFNVDSEDVVPIPAYATYNLWPETQILKVLLVMEFLDFDKLPKK